MSIVPSLRRAAARGSCRDAVILSASRTPIGSFMGNLKGLSAPELGAVAIKSAVEKAGIDVKDIGEVLMGNVLSANIGQAPARQASIKAGIPYEAGCTTVNKVCSSGLKSVMLAAQSIILGNCDVAVAGGMESMSQVPFYMSKTPPSYGHNQMLDGILKDGLWDAFDDRHMGACAEVLAEEMKISRESQDNFCLESYARVAQATEKGLFKDEIAQVVIPQRRGDPIVIKDDEEFQRLKADKVKSLKPAFKKDGTVTAANASSLNDGAAALVVASREYAEKKGLTPLATIRDRFLQKDHHFWNPLSPKNLSPFFGHNQAFADAAKLPVEFTTAPAKAIPLALQNAEMELSEVDLFEINEAFSVVSLANNQILGLDPEKVNVNGGAVGLGHPIGCSGARILVTLVHALAQREGKAGVAGICNGGGGASALVIERE